MYNYYLSLKNNSIFDLSLDISLCQKMISSAYRFGFHLQ
jgi:hypothetical protein